VRPGAGGKIPRPASTTIQAKADILPRAAASVVSETRFAKSCLMCQRYSAPRVRPLEEASRSVRTRPQPESARWAALLSQPYVHNWIRTGAVR
jgi:hypothetical protein